MRYVAATDGVCTLLKSQVRAKLVVPVAFIASAFVSIAGARAQTGGAPEDALYARIAWPNASVEASATGEPDAAGDPTRRVSYPLTYLLDGDVATTWAYPTGVAAKNANPPRLSFTFDSVTFDSVRIVNGYNKSDDTWTRNSRAAAVRLKWDENTPRMTGGEKTARLSDKRDWHVISVPRRAYSSLDLFITDVKAGTAHNDLCISEIAFYDGVRKVDLKMPAAVLFGYFKGDEVYPEYLMNRRGDLLATSDAPEGGEPEWSANGRYVAGWDGKSVWVADARTARAVRRVFPFVAAAKSGLNTENSDVSLRWKNNRTVVITLDSNSSDKPIKREQTITL